MPARSGRAQLGTWGRLACWVSDAHLHSILRKEGTGVGLHGELQAGGVAPERAASEKQASSPLLAVVVAFAKEVWEQGVDANRRKMSKERRGRIRKGD